MIRKMIPREGGANSPNYAPLPPTTTTTTAAAAYLLTIMMMMMIMNIMMKIVMIIMPITHRCLLGCSANYLFHANIPKMIRHLFYVFTTFG